MIGNWVRSNQLAVWLGATGSILATIVTNDAMPAITTYFGYSTAAPASIPIKIGIYFAAFLVTIFTVLALFWGIPWLVRRLATWCIVFLAYGFRSWADGRSGPLQAKDLWNWISDQVLVAQGRHAFSVECIAFQEAEERKSAKVVLLYRSFPGFKKPVYLWPGGRIRGVEDDLGEEATKIFKRETGCSVKLVRSTAHDGERINSIDGNGQEISNRFSAPPFLVMHQNRPQKFGVPGHTALLYVGSLDVSDGQLDEVRLIDVERIRTKDDLHKLELWPDTAKSILLAYEFWLTHNGTVKVQSASISTR